VSKVSLVLAPSRALSPRLVGKGNWANEGESKARQIAIMIKPTLRGDVELKIDWDVA
jgi:hypothetical protein